jgi:hypothetical protein
MAAVVAVVNLLLMLLLLAMLVILRVRACVRVCGEGEEGGHHALGVVNFLLDKPRIDDVVDAVNGQGSLGNVGGNHHLRGRNTRAQHVKE